MQHIQHVIRIGSANPKMACEMHFILMHVFKLELKIRCSLYDVPSPMHVNKYMDARMHCIRYANFKYALIYHHKQVNKREERNGGWKTYTHPRTLITDLPSLGGTERIIQIINYAS